MVALKVPHSGLSMTNEELAPCFYEEARKLAPPAPSGNRYDPRSDYLAGPAGHRLGTSIQGVPLSDLLEVRQPSTFAESANLLAATAEAAGVCPPGGGVVHRREM